MQSNLFLVLVLFLKKRNGKDCIFLRVCIFEKLHFLTTFSPQHFIHFLELFTTVSGIGPTKKTDKRTHVETGTCIWELNSSCTDKKRKTHKKTSPLPFELCHANVGLFCTALLLPTVFNLRMWLESLSSNNNQYYIFQLGSTLPPRTAMCKDLGPLGLCRPLGWPFFLSFFVLKLCGELIAYL